ncbi:MAG: hypothetical protein U0X40_03795 [Ferruginibacter sp.]
MQLRAAILQEHSKAQCLRIVKWVGHNQEHFDELFNLFMGDEYRVVQRAAWAVSCCVQAHPFLLEKHWKSFAAKLNQPNLPDAVKRNSVRLLQEIAIPEAYKGLIMGRCFQLLEAPAEALAVKVFSMTVLANMAKEFPAIIPELRYLIEEQLPRQSAGFRSRAKKILPQLARS